MNRINVMTPWLGEEETAAIAAVIASGWVAQGPRVAEFEQRFAEAQHASHAVALSSCTAALHLALEVAGVGAGDEVIVPSHSFIATTNCVSYVNATPVFADVDAATGNVTADTVAAALTSRTRAVIAVDQAGVPVDLSPIRELCDPLGIIVIEDAACGAGSRYRNEPVGSGAELATWSFHPRKVLTTGEGGMLTCQRRDRAERATRLREHAMSISAAQRHTSSLAPAEEYREIGFNYRMTDIQAAMGIVQLSRLAEMIERRRSLAAAYQEAFADLPGLRCVTDPPHGSNNYQSFWIELGPDAPETRDGLLAALAAADISARRGIMAAHRQPAYRHLAPEGSLPTTERLTDRTLILPLFHTMSESEQQRVVETVRGTVS